MDLKQFTAADTSAEDLSALGSQIEAQLPQMLLPFALILTALERILAGVHSSEVLPNLAKLQRKYYVELVDAGFTEEQATGLISNFGSLLTALKASQGQS